MFLRHAEKHMLQLWEQRKTMHRKSLRAGSRQCSSNFQSTCFCAWWKTTKFFWNGLLYSLFRMFLFLFFVFTQAFTNCFCKYWSIKPHAMSIPCNSFDFWAQVFSDSNILPYLKAEILWLDETKIIVQKVVFIFKDFAHPYRSSQWG